MLSLYIHIPFCEKKCKYCNFFVIPTKDYQEFETIKDNYTNSIISQIKYWAQFYPNEEIKTIHLGGGSPQMIGNQNITKIIDCISDQFDLTYLEELGIELNPYPYDEIVELINFLNEKYKNIFRLRYSFGIQTFDDNILKETGRQYYFNYLVGFIRQLTVLKSLNNVYNFDFICFGQFNKDKQGNDKLWDDNKINFFNDFIASGMADSLSLYTLELFPGSMMYVQQSKQLRSDMILQDNIYHEFELLKSKILDNGYKRYEISNFASIGKGSIHNRIYWQMENYIGLGISASSFLKNEYVSKLDKCFLGNIAQDQLAIRFNNTLSWEKFSDGKYIDQKSIIAMYDEDMLIERFILGLRTDQGIRSIDLFKSILVDNYGELIDNYKKDGLIISKDNQIILTDKGMDLYNEVILNLLKKI